MTSFEWGSPFNEMAPPPTRRAAARRAPRAELDAVRAALGAYATERLYLLSPAGEWLASSTSATFSSAVPDLHPEDVTRVRRLVRESAELAGGTTSIRVRVRSAYGTWGQFEATIIDATRNPTLEGVVVRLRDLTDDVDEPPRPGLTRSPDRAAVPDRFLSLAEALPMGILSADAGGSVAFSNEAAQQILGLGPEHLLAHGWESAVHHEDLSDVVSAAGRVVLTGTPAQATFRVHTGVFFRWVHAKYVPLGAPAEGTGWIATLEDVTDRRRTESRLAHQATHDPLTDLPNRTLLEDRLNQACGRLQRDTSSVTLLFVDLDGFKGVNDTLGHAAGDRVLIETARRLRGVIRDVDTVARLGGDEFVVVCENLPEADQDGLLARVHGALGKAVPGLPPQAAIRASIGVAHTRDPLVEPNELLARADQSMYRAKQSRLLE